jgi:hypothetical protein
MRSAGRTISFRSTSSALVDAGSALVDAGSALVDAGSALVDAGSALVDAGSALVDGGSALVDGAATRRCRNIDDVDGDAVRQDSCGPGRCQEKSRGSGRCRTGRPKPMMYARRGASDRFGPV